MQFGPHTGMPASRAMAAISSWSFAPSPPSSAKPKS